MTEQHGELEAPFPRRRFLTLALGVVQGLVALILGIPAVAYIVSPVRGGRREEWVLLGSISGLTERPQRLEFQYEDAGGYTIRSVRKAAYAFLADGEPVVLSPVCTHMGCNVSWRDDGTEFRCPCHGGRFDLAGSVTDGPPPRPLRRYETRVSGDDLEIRLG